MNSPRIVCHKLHKVKYSGVVLCRLDTYIVKRRSVAEVVLRSIGVCVEHIRMCSDKSALLVIITEQVVKVRIHTE